ncbi:MutS-related protein [Myroides sp. LJL115]
MGIYSKNIELFEKKYDKIRKKYKVVASCRLVVFLAILYFFYLALAREDFYYMYISLGFIVVFVIFLKLHLQYKWKMQYAHALLQVNQKELDFVKNGIADFDDGKEFIDPSHPFSYDLDLFGAKSLFEYLNRTASYIGKVELSKLLKNGVDTKEIEQNQKAIKELSQKIEWRQQINAFSSMCDLDQNAYEKIVKWKNIPVVLQNKTTMALAYICPILLWSCIGIYFFVESIALGYIISTMFSINLLLSISKTREIQRQLGGSDDLSKTINSYSAILDLVERQSFTTPKMQAYLQEFIQGGSKASKKIKTLYHLFERLETVNNLFVMVLFNGFGQYHIHVLQKLLHFKKDNADILLSSINSVGQIEALNSLANFSYNNRDFCFPTLSKDKQMFFTDLGHPLLNPTKRVCNDISFDKERFVILTGSNMSGKSTFLRTIGVNLVLAKMGAPICASSASFIDLPLYVSMGVSDSLKDSESYFYAEVKRLELIIKACQKQPTFVLLDEILRGTNSEDKQSGTIGVILKLISQKTYGIIATHDLEVCNITYDYPQILTNKCFEVEIKQEDLFFDYKIREGVCQNKNATFIMKKMQIID